MALEKQLGRICNELDDMKGLKQAAELVRSIAVANCPVGWGELQSSITTDVHEDEDGQHVAEIYTSKEYAFYVELGTGPKGAANHSGISPEVSPSYTLEPWYIHESQISPDVASRYHFRHIDTKDGRFYICYGQPAQPYLYPALKDNEDEVLDIIRQSLKEQIRSTL